MILITSGLRLMQSLLRTLSFIVILLLTVGGFRIFGQCPSGNTHPAITVQCGSPCIPMSFIVPDIRNTSDYIVLDHPYTPFAFEDRTKPAVVFAPPAQWPSNSYSALYNLPFPFCFFDSTYNYLTIGSNGCVSFDSSMAMKLNDPRLINTLNGRPVPLPSGLYYARALIAAVMQDLDPLDTARVVTGEKVEYRIEGIAPCRKIVISYYKIPLFPGQTLNCQFSIQTYQMVLHEGTGIIDVYEKDKPSCAGSNNGRAILGIQNWNRDYAVTARFRNDSVWGANNINESFRFLPYGGTSRFLQANITDGIHIIATTTTATPGTGLNQGQLTVQFSSVCPGPTNNFLILQTIYSSCTGTGTAEYFDTIWVNHNTQLSTTVQTIPPSCGGSNGSIIIHVTPGGGTPNYAYSINGGTLQPDSVFSGLAAGTYTLHAQDNGGCDTTFSFTLIGSNLLFINTIVDSPSCTLANDGSITVNVLNGNPPFRYSINGGGFQPGNVFTGLAPGSYVIDVLDNIGCASTSTHVVVPVGPPLAATIQATPTSCSGATNGTITITPTNGSPPYSYSLNGGSPQSSNIFTNLAVGSYTIHVIDGSGCEILNLPAQITPGQPLAPFARATNVTCNGGSDGTLTVLVPNGTGPFQYSLNGVNFQNSNVFIGLTPGNYTVYVKDNNGCSGTTTAIISQPTALTASSISADAKCFGDANGIITVNANGGSAPYQYSLDGINYQTLNIFSGLAAGNYTIRVKDNYGCNTTLSATVNQPQPLLLSATTQNASCGGGNDGKITASASGGNNNYVYSQNGINFQSSNIFNVAPGTYTITVKDIMGCTATQSNIIVGLTNTLAIQAISDTSICESRSINLNAISNAAQYSWTPSTGLSNPAIANPVASPTITTTYFVDASLGACQGRDTVTITVLPAPVANAGNDQRVCLNDSVQLNGSGGLNYQWSPALTLSSGTISNPFARPKQTTIYNLFVADANGCRSLAADVVTVTVIPPVNPNITNDTYVTPGQTLQLHSEGGANYSWSPSSGLNNPFISDPIATITQDITYTVTVTTTDGCKSMDSVHIKAYKGPEIYVPSGFTPNHDGKNDKLVPIAVGIQKLEYFQVYDRWGKLVFSTNQMREGWDGRLKGMDQDSGVFVWVVKGITNDGNVIFKKGTVMLIR